MHRKSLDLFFSDMGCLDSFCLFSDVAQNVNYLMVDNYLKNKLKKMIEDLNCTEELLNQNKQDQQKCSVL